MQDAAAFRDEQQVPDRIEERDSALDRCRGHSLTLDGGEFITQLCHALLKLVVALVELGQPLGGHVAPAGGRKLRCRLRPRRVMLSAASGAA
jgi:hypothetical protein